MDKFWKSLQSKLERKPTQRAHEKFWTAFDQEFSAPAKSRNWFRALNIPVWVPVAASLTLVVGLWWNQHQTKPAHNDAVFLSEAIQHEELLSDLEFFSDFETAEGLVDANYGEAGDVI